MLDLLRISIAAATAGALSLHGLKKKSLDLSGSLAAVFVGFTSFACSYRFGIILILFYYTSSKLTKFKQEVKLRLEEDHAEGSERNWMQVFASSFFATVVAVLFYFTCGEDQHLSFAAPRSHNEVFNLDLLVLGQVQLSRRALATYLWSMYIAHYATANADTWASEIGVLSTARPRLVTSFLLREVPPGTNGAISGLGTLASAAGGFFIGAVFWTLSLVAVQESAEVQQTYPLSSGQSPQYPILLFALLCGFLGSLIDSILGATIQASYYSIDRKCIVKARELARINNSKSMNASGYNASPFGNDPIGYDKKDDSVVLISGFDFISNEMVNLLSILFTMILSIWLAPNVFCALESTECYEAHRINNWLTTIFTQWTGEV